MTVFDALVDDLKRRWDEWEGDKDKRSDLSGLVLASKRARVEQEDVCART
jgi:hypothetical protein